MAGGEPDVDANLRRTSPAQRRVGLAFALLLAGAGLWTIRSFLPALLWAAVIAVATWPIYSRTRRRWPPGRRDILWPALFSAAVALVFLIPLALAAVQVGREAQVLVGALEHARIGGLPVPAFLPTLPGIGSVATSWWSENLARPAEAAALLDRLGHQALASRARTLGSEVIHRGIVFGFTILTLFFLYRDGDRISRQLLDASRHAVGPRGERVARHLVASVHGTVNGLVLVGLGEGFLLGIAYWLAAVPHPALFGAATAIAAMIPFGAALMFGAAALLVLAQGTAGAALGIVAFGTLVVFVADHLVRPALIGGATNLPFLLVLLGILGGVETFGLLGLFLGPALMAVLHLLWREWLAGRAEA